MKLTRLLTLFVTILMTSCVSSKDGSDIRAYISDLKKQYPVPELSKAEMYADFDTLVSIMEHCNPQYLIRKKVTDYDMVSEMKTQRVHIENCKNTSDFVKLLKTVFALSLDEHCVGSGSFVWHYKRSFF